MDTDRLHVLIAKALAQLLTRAGSGTYITSQDVAIGKDLQQVAEELEREFDRQDRIRQATREAGRG